MAVGDQDHRRVAMPVAATLSGALHQPFDLALGEVAPLDCQVLVFGVRLPDADFIKQICSSRAKVSSLNTFIGQSTATAPWHRCPCDHTAIRPLEEPLYAQSVRLP